MRVTCEVTLFFFIHKKHFNIQFAKKDDNIVVNAVQNCNFATEN